MRVRATLRIRNDYMIAARERLGLSQITLAATACVPLRSITFLEALRYDIPLLEDVARRVAHTLEISVDKVAPPGLVDAALTTTFEAVREITDRALLSRASTQMKLLAPDSAATQREFVDEIRNQVDLLPDRTQTIIRMKYGLPPYDREHTYGEIGKRLNISSARVAEVLKGAKHQLKKPFERAD